MCENIGHHLQTWRARDTWILHIQIFFGPLHTKPCVILFSLVFALQKFRLSHLSLEISHFKFELFIYVVDIVMLRHTNHIHNSIISIIKIYHIHQPILIYLYIYMYIYIYVCVCLVWNMFV